MNSIIGEIDNKPVTKRSNKQNKWELSIGEAVELLGKYGNNSSNSGSNFRYFRVCYPDRYEAVEFIKIATYVKSWISDNESTYITPPFTQSYLGEFTEVAIDMNLIVTTFSNGTKTEMPLLEFIKQHNFEDFISEENEITSEEFWRNDFFEGNVITFYIGDFEFNAFNGMTFAEYCGGPFLSSGSWSEPSLNVEGSGGYVYVSYGGVGGGNLKDALGNDVLATDHITPGAQYFANSPGN